MSKKAGRPPLPKGQSKDIQIGVRFKPEDDNQLDRIVGKGESKAQWVREAARLLAHDGVNCDYTVEELDRKKVMFKIWWEDKRMPIEGTGTIMALQMGDGSLKIQIQSQSDDEEPDVYYRFLMPPEAGPWLKKLPKGSKCDFSVVDPSL